MVLRRIRTISTFAFFSLILALAQISCTELRGPGIMPPVSENDYGQWEVLGKTSREVKGLSGQPMRQWQITARYVPEPDGAGLAPPDIFATLDGVPVPFSFDARSQLFESTPPPLPLSGAHRFVIMPSEERSRPFPTLTLDLDEP